MKIAIGLAGPIRCGKATVGKIIERELNKLGFSVVTHVFSDVLVETQKLWHLPPGRETLQGISICMQERFPKCLANAVERRALGTKEDCVILDGLRWFNSDLPVLRRLPNSKLVYIDASAELRWQRSLRDPQKPDEANATFEQFLARDNARTEIEVPLFRDQADAVIDNSKDIDNLEMQIGIFVNLGLNI